VLRRRHSAAACIFLTRILSKIFQYAGLQLFQLSRPGFGNSEGAAGYHEKKRGVFPILYLAYSLRLLAATIVGGILGFERSKAGRNAGIKTHSIVCLGACLVACVGDLFNINSDPTDFARIACQVIPGIGFLGAGVIMTSEINRVVGLTTAAGLWFSACIGIAIGSEYWWLAIPAVLCFFIITHLFSKIEEKSVPTDKW
jgi:uncharacterized membrane protein YhiD involved in acid resistance